MNSKRIITFFLVFLLIGVPLHAQYHFEHFDSRDGLSQTSIRTMIQDSTGYIWMGTFGGLIRYDGYNFKTYSHNVDDPQSLPNDDVTSLVIDDHQNLWIGTTHGLAVMNLKTHKFKNYHVDPPVCKLVDESIRSLFIDDQKRIWIGTKNKGVCYFDATLNQFVIPPLPRLRNVRSFIQSTDGSIYYSSFNEGIQRFKLTKDSSVLSLKNYPIEKANIRYLYHEQDTIYAGTNNGLYRKYPVDSVFTRIPQPNGHYDFFRSIAKTKEGYWLGTLDGLIYCTAIDDIQTGQYERYFRGNDPASIMSNSYIFSLFQDRSRQLWIGTEDGLESYDFFVNQFKRLKKSIPSGDYVPHVTKINRLSSGQLLLGTRYPGLLYETDKTFERYLPDTHEVTSIERVDESHYYIGLGSGSVLDLHTNPKHVQTIHLPNCETSVYTLTKIDENRILCGTRSNGLYLYDIQKQKAVAFRPSIFTKLCVSQCVMDSNQKIWIASDHGIITISRNLKNLKFYLSRMAGEKDDKVINAIFIDTYGNVWGGSKNGLYRYDPVSDQFLIEPTIPSLKTAWITNIEEDSLNRLWLNLNYNRIARYDRIKHEYKTYYVHNGTRSNRMNTYEFFKADEHHMYIGGEKGIYSFDPLNITENTYSPRPFISGVRVNNKDISPEDTINNNVPLKEDINFSHQIVLQYQNRNVTFDLSSASYVNRISNRFKYRLKGHDKQWVMLPMRSHYINFSRLSVGSYVLELQACNNNGHWSDIQHYTIRVLAPWWISGWAYFFYFIFAGLVIFYLIVQGRHRQTLRRALMTEQIKREQTEVLNEDKLRFFTNISHELRTPLTLILGPAYQLSEDKTLNNMAHKKIVMIRSHAQRMLSLINQILDLRKAESGRLQLKVSLVQLNKLTQEVYASFTDFAASKNICFDFNRDPNVMEGYVDKGMYMTMLYNLVSNALKFTPEKGHVSLSLKLKEQRGSRYLLVTVADDGIGIPKEGQVHIFSRFYQAANSHSSTTGSGIGLSLVQRMVELHGGKISFDSVERQGTTFYIELPIDKQAYPAAAIQLETSKKRLLQKEKVRSDMFDVTIAQKSPAFVKDEETLGCMRNKKTILLIEDNQELRSFAADILSNHYQVEQASDGVEGLEKCREIQPNLCVVDVMMPRLDGFGFLEILKQEEAISHIPVVMLTAMDENKNRMFGYKLGADAYLTKPFDPNLLMSRIENILRNRKLLLNRFATGIPKEKRTLVDEAVALGSSPLDEVFLKKMTELIAKNISNSEFTVKEFSKEMAVSTSKLYRKIKGLTDLSPNEYLRLIRLKEGARLLKETNLSISEISYQVGFSDPLYFSRCFKKQFNKAPSEVRK